MKNEFSSKVYLKNSLGNRILNIIFAVIGVVVFGCIFIKMIVGDFRISDISGIIFTIVLIALAKSRVPKKPIYGYGTGILDFAEEKMTITYPNINSTIEKGPFKETVVIRYEDIETIQYGKALECFRIVAASDRKREYLSGKCEIVQLATPDIVGEVFIYVLDEEMQPVVLKNIQKYARFIVTVIEN